jgi:uracil-DNA glycosylase
VVLYGTILLLGSQSWLPTALFKDHQDSDVELQSEMITSFFAPKKAATLSSNTKRVRNNDGKANDEEENSNDNNVVMTTSTDKRQKQQSSTSSREDVDDNNNVVVTSTDKRQKKSSTSQEDVDDMLSSLQDDAWKQALASIFDSTAFARLSSFVATERKSHTIYPSKLQTWDALNHCRLNDVKVVIVGQDPYHGPGQAHGLCFSVLPGHKPPPSLNNIYKELLQDPAIANFNNKPNHGHLIRWAKQGVLMLNTVLTVRRGQANSHQKKGWENVTNGILRALQDKPCVFLLWGKPAAQKAQAANIIDMSMHVVIGTSHPSPLGATKTNAPFLGSRCFSRCNEELIKMGHAPIDWNVDGGEL